MFPQRLNSQDKNSHNFILTPINSTSRRAGAPYESNLYGGYKKGSDQRHDTVDSNGIGRAGVRDEIVIPNANAHECLQVISDVERYPEFMPIYSNIQVLSEEKNLQANQTIKIARYNLRVPITVYPFIKDLSYVLRLTINESRNFATLYWEQINGPSFVVNNVGQWNVYQRENDVIMQLELCFGYSFYLPKHIKSIIQKHILNNSLHNIKKRIVDMQRFKSQQHRMF